MNEKESFMSGIWINLHKRCGSNHEISLKVFTEAVIETRNYVRRVLLLNEGVFC